MTNKNISIASVFRTTPSAGALVRGSEKYPSVKGTVRFYRMYSGTLVLAQITGLPTTKEGDYDVFFGFHIHEGASCNGNSEDPFAKVGSHLGGASGFHPYHTGDMPPLLNAGGDAFLSFLTNRFTVDEIIGKTVVIHSGADDFRTQPGGDSGEKIACGEIIKMGK